MPGAIRSRPAWWSCLECECRQAVSSELRVGKVKRSVVALNPNAVIGLIVRTRPIHDGMIEFDGNVAPHAVWFPVQFVW